MDNLFGERFYSFRQPAWHTLGKVLDEPHNAQEAFKMLTPYDVEVQELRLPNGEVITQHRAIVRTPVPDDPQLRVLGICGPEYHVIAPWDVCRTWDEAVSAPVETLGALGYGETMFISTKLPTIGIMGDEIENYLLFVSPYTGFEAAQARVTGIRVVCQNTLEVAKSRSTEVYKIVHDEYAVEKMKTWLNGIYERSVERAESLKQFYEILAQTKVKSPEDSTVIENVYPLPNPPVENAPQDVMLRRQEWFEANRESVLKSRQAVQRLFDGAGTGMNVPAAKGTAWGLYNAVVEWEDYRGRHDLPSQMADKLFGTRASAKRKAFEEVLVLAS